MSEQRSTRGIFRFSLRELLLVIVITALAAAWWRENSQKRTLIREHQADIAELEEVQFLKRQEKQSLDAQVDMLVLKLNARELRQMETISLLENQLKRLLFDQKLKERQQTELK